MTIFIFIITASRLLDMTDLIVNQKVDLGDIFSLFLCLVPKIILFAMPISCLMAVLLSFLRMSSDNEIIVLHSSGISLYQLMPPVIIFSLICFLFAGFLTLFWIPYGNRTYESKIKDIVKTGVISKIKEGVFFEQKGVIFLVNSYSPRERIMNDVFVAHEKNGQEVTIIAKKAKFIPSKNGIVIRFMDGAMFTDDSRGKSPITEFPAPGYFDYPIEIDNLVESSEGGVTEPDAMYFRELLEFIKLSTGDKIKLDLAKLVFYEMFSIPLAVLLIGIAGAPLGAQIRSQGRTKGIIISLMLFLSYYIFLMVIRYMCENGVMIPAIGVWLPVLFLLLICVFLLFVPVNKYPYYIFRRLKMI